MKKPTLRVLVLLTALCFAAACDSGGPSAPENELDTTFRGTFTPTSVSDNGACTLVMEALPTGGLPGYRCEWNMAWINAAASARGYPNECRVDITLPDTFGPGLFPFDLFVLDARNDRVNHFARAGTDEPLDCTDDEQKLFFGS